MHLPPDLAAFLVSQLTISPASSLWKVYTFESAGHMVLETRTVQRTYNGGGRVAMVLGLLLGRVVGNDVNWELVSLLNNMGAAITFLPSMLPFLSWRPQRFAM